MTLIDEDHPKKYMAIRKHTVQALQVFKVRYHERHLLKATFTCIYTNTNTKDKNNFYGILV